MSGTTSASRWVGRGACLALMVGSALAGPSTVGAQPGDEPGLGFLGEGGGQGQAVHGRAAGGSEADGYGIGLQAHRKGDEARGRLVFRHKAESGPSGFAGRVTCLSVGEDGVVQVSGTTEERGGHRHGGEGGMLQSPGRDDKGAEAAQDFAFTIQTGSEPQRFSLPRMGAPGSLTPCGGGEATTVEVARGGFRTHG